MKKISIITLLFLFFITGCTNEDVIENIPNKTNATDTGAMGSSVNSTNLDNYMFRDDVQYVDLRDSKMILEEGYVAGFEFIPFYNILASFNEGEALYQMRRVVDGENVYAAGQVGGFVAQYEESEFIVKSLFSKDKYIFLISQGGSESAYLINLLLQLGYNGDLLYNVGGVSTSEGSPSYKSIDTNKYYITGYNGFDINVDYGFLEDLTPLN